MPEHVDRTLCFTEIVRSTRVRRVLGSRVYGDLVQRHAEVLRSCVYDAGGLVVSEREEGCFLAFTEPAAGLEFAVAAQRALTAEPWPPAAPIRVRIGLHRGPVTESGGEWSGLPVHQTARVAAAAHGGQVLLTSAVGDGAELPTGVLAVPLGRYRLRDFDGGVDLLTLRGPGLPSGFPALGAAPAGTGTPMPASSLVGRHREISEVVELIHSVPLVTIVGPPGIGKTRLALEAAAIAASSFPDGLHVCEVGRSLRPPGLLVDSPDDVARAVAISLLMRPDPDEAPLAALVEHLRPGRRLLVLDACQDRVDSVAALVEQVLRRCPHTCVLVTSHVPVQVPGERVLRLGPLAHPEETSALFLQRAGGAAPSWLGGLAELIEPVPLAIELGAALYPAGAGEPAGEPEGPTALQVGDLLERAYQALDLEERDLLRRLSLLEGHWRADCFPQAALEGLLRRNLVTTLTGGPERLEVTESVRGIARTEPEPVDFVRWRGGLLLDALAAEPAGSAAAVAAEAAAVWVDLCAALSGPPGQPVETTAALLVLMADWLATQGFWAQGADWLRTAAGAELPAALSAELRAALALHEARRGRGPEAQEAAEAVLAEPAATRAARSRALVALATRPGSDEVALLTEAVAGFGERDIVAALEARLRLARAHARAGAVEPAAQQLTRIERESTEAGQPALAAHAMALRGALLLRAGDLAAAEVELRRGQALARQTGLSSVAAAALGNLSALLLQRGDSTEALLLAEERLELAVAARDLKGQAAALSVIGTAAAAGDVPRARAALQRSVELSRRCGSPEGVSGGLFNLAVLESREQRFGAAAVAVGELLRGTATSLDSTLGLVAAAGVASAAGRPEGLLLLAAATSQADLPRLLEPADRLWLADAQAVAERALGQQPGAATDQGGRQLSAAEAAALAVQVMHELATADATGGLASA